MKGSAVEGALVRGVLPVDEVVDKGSSVLHKASYEGCHLQVRLQQSVLLELRFQEHQATSCPAVSKQQT